MNFQIEDLVEFSDGSQGIVSSYKSEMEIVVVPLDKGVPRVVSHEEIKLLYSFLGALDNLSSDEELQKVLTMSEEMLAKQQSEIKEKKKREKKEKEPEEIIKQVEI